MWGRGDVVEMNNTQLCRGKKIYQTEEEATSIAVKTLAHVNNCSELRVYQCEVCRKFHLTKKQDKYRRNLY